MKASQNEQKPAARGGYTIEHISGEFSVCRMKPGAAVDLSGDFVFAGKTDGELSLVLRTQRVPDDTEKREDGWSLLRFAGCLDFSLTGVLAAISAVLAARNISIFAVSTYDTDYILIRTERLGDSLDALRRAGYAIKE